jgi:hypothetical protein
MPSNGRAGDPYYDILLRMVRQAIIIAKQAGSSGGGIGSTAATVTSGQTYAVKSTDIVIRMDTSGGATATADLPAAGFIGERHTFYWWNWGVGQTPPTINANGLQRMVPYNGQESAGAAGLVAQTTITNPGASFTLVWDGTEWTSTS